MANANRLAVAACAATSLLEQLADYTITVVFICFDNFIVLHSTLLYKIEL